MSIKPKKTRAPVILIKTRNPNESTSIKKESHPRMSRFVSI